MVGEMEADEAEETVSISPRLIQALLLVAVINESGLSPPPPPQELKKEHVLMLNGPWILLQAVTLPWRGGYNRKGERIIRAQQPHQRSATQCK
jgi:hypothetical protein